MFAAGTRVSYYPPRSIDADYGFLISEKHLTVQRNRRDPITHRLRDDWGE